MGEDAIRTEVYQKLSTLTMVVTGGLIFILVFTISMTSLMVFQAYRSGQQAATIKQVAVETHSALCTFRGDLARRYNDGLAYEKEHPNGVPALGLSSADLQRSLAAQKSTLDSLTVLDCE